jgi:two-component system response regulator RegA
MSMPRLLLIDDDLVFGQVVSKALAQRGFTVDVAQEPEAAVAAAQAAPPDYAVVDLRLEQASGLDLLQILKGINPAMRIVVLTGYASIATAVEAIKLGATHYLTKPADADEIIAAFHRDQPAPDVPVPSDPMSVRRLTWEHMQKVLMECSGNISEAARRLNMHRRTLQRKLQKYPPRQ